MKLLIKTVTWSALLLTTCTFTSLALAAPAAQSIPETAHERPVPLIIYAAIGYDKAMGAAFQQATGIPTEVQEIRTGELLARVEAEKQNPQWGLVWFDGALAMQELADQHLLLSYAPKINWSKYGTEMQPENHDYVTTAATFADVITVNSNTLPENQWPKTWDDLLNPRYKVGMDNPAISGETSTFVMGQIAARGESAAYHYFLNLKKNGLKIYNVNPITDRALQYGEINVALVQSSSALGHAASGLPFHVIYASPSSLVPRVIGISAQANPEVQAEAKRFIRFVLSPEGQHVVHTGAPKGDSNVFPVLAGEKARKGVPTLEEIAAQGVKIQYLNPIQWAPRNASIKNWFTTNITR
ncbi:ABC transporter substrate-binding protein [Acidithiobacillus concretivorus]|uniref:Extracellular solute-binding protein n=1 Tax=Acidithiobacillus concretivorus TaxID=3063952 RepID=A0ABS5ZLE7_9PROT|nr:extracellular solute-binding protein [Acidithiobacillus concretivorus]MBU2737488.1 extracellular solute-binding protein [Acidithiobacillus concretivorus]